MNSLKQYFRTSQPEQWVFLAVIITLMIKLVIASVIPMTGDEAYFIIWGKHPDYGYYDHPAMVGWLLSLLLWVSDATVWLRTPGIIFFTFIGVAIFWILKSYDKQAAALTAILFLFTPMNLLGVLITTDTPLILFSFISAWFFYRAQADDGIQWYLLTGLFLGLAFYSKFFAGLLGLAYFFNAVFIVRGRRGLKPYTGILAIIIGTLPFIALNLYWNYNNCWNNYLFNLLNRTSDAQFSFRTVGIYLGLLLYLITPPIIYYLIKCKKQFVAIYRDSDLSVYLGLFFIPILLFLLLAFWKEIGLHWLFSFYPFLFIALGYILDLSQLRKTLYFMVIFSLLHVVTILVLISLLPGLVENKENTYKDVLYGLRNNVILRKLDKYKNDYQFATDSYVESSLLSYTARRYVIVIGRGAYHGREDDKITDFRKLDGQNILIISYSSQLDYLADFFDSFEIKPLKIEKATFYYALGRGFDYQAYRKKIIKKNIADYYAIPGWLPHGDCYMYKRYRE